MQDEAERLRAAVSHFQKGEHQSALKICQSLFLGPTGISGAAHQLTGLVLHAEDDLEEASRHLRWSVLINPTGRAARKNFSVVEGMRDNAGDQVRQHRILLFLDPTDADAWHGLSLQDLKAGETNTATDKNRRALLSTPGDSRYLEACADLLIESKDSARAARTMRLAFFAEPNSIPLIRKTVEHLSAINAHSQGLEILQSALRIRENADLRIVAGYMFRGLWRNPEAADHFRRALLQAPESGDALLGLMWCRRQACDWDGDLQWLTKAHDLFLQSGLASPQPAFALAWSSDPEAQLKAARFVARAHIGAVLDTSIVARHGVQVAKHGQRIKIGYISPNFGEHPVGRCIIEVLERHDRARFEVFAYASKDHGDHEIMRRTRSCVENFRDMDKASEGEIRDRIMADEIEILVDLDGYSQGLPGVIARRPAPVLVNFLGYAGTSGGLHDYLINDRKTIRAGTEKHYAEKIVWMPNCFLPPPTEGTEHVATPSRRDEGLPEDRLVLAAFHTAFKITPEAFDAWCRILHAVPRAVLWLLDGPPPHGDTLRAAARRRRVSSDRLIFARFRAAHAEHLARLPLADLYLDTFPHTAHSTAAELMYRGCPLVTRSGNAFASRVGASVLEAAGVTELVTHDWDSFVEKAIRLSLAPNALEDLRRRLRDARAHSPLFDRAGYTRALENGFIQMAARHRAGQSPVEIEIKR
jgi:protein O-GlcNAc transferase